MGSLKVYFWNFIHGYSLSYARLSYICHQRHPRWSYAPLQSYGIIYSSQQFFTDVPPTFTPKIKPYNPSSPFLWQKYKYISWKNRPLFSPDSITIFYDLSIIFYIGFALNKSFLFHWPRVSWHYLWLLSAIFHLIRFLLLLFALCAELTSSTTFESFARMEVHGW